MRLKCNRNRPRARSPSARNDFAQNVGMGLVNAVEIPHAYKRRSVVGRDILEFVEHLHIRMIAELVTIRRRNQSLLFDFPQRPQR
jgi:hypothetical protein